MIWYLAVLKLKTNLHEPERQQRLLPSSWTQQMFAEVFSQNVLTQVLFCCRW